MILLNKLQSLPSFRVDILKLVWVARNVHDQTLVLKGRSLPRFCHSMKPLGQLLLPLDEMLVHRRVGPQQYIAGTHLCTWVKRDSVE